MFGLDSETNFENGIFLQKGFVQGKNSYDNKTEQGRGLNEAAGSYQIANILDLTEINI